MSQYQKTTTAILPMVSEKDFRYGVMPRAQLSKLACEIALANSTNDDVKQFAEWELLEATTVIDVLQDLDTPVSPVKGDAKAFLENLEALTGDQFDKAFMNAELSNHEFLRDLAQSYLDNEAGKPSGNEKEIWHIAGLALFAFTEHVGLCNKILSRQHL